MRPCLWDGTLLLNKESAKILTYTNKLRVSLLTDQPVDRRSGSPGLQKPPKPHTSPENLPAFHLRPNALRVGNPFQRNTDGTSNSGLPRISSLVRHFELASSCGPEMSMEWGNHFFHFAFIRAKISFIRHEMDQAQDFNLHNRPLLGYRLFSHQNQ